MTAHPSDDRLAAFALGTADPADGLAVETHLNGCVACCDRLDRAAPDDGFSARVRAAGVAWDPDETRMYAAPASDLPASLGVYRVERVLGRGGMGTVYLAHDDRLRRAVALKTMRPDVAAKSGAAGHFLREARAAAQVEHDNVVPIWQVGEDGGVPYIAMPFLRGESLADRLRREPVSPVGLTLQVAREVAEGLAAAHDRGLTHRDVKPANIWLEGDPAGPVRRCKILDFGLAHAVETECAHTAAGLTVGSPGFMAPEQAAARPVDGRADLFSLGAVLYRMAAGRPPFESPTPGAYIAAVTADNPEDPAGGNCPPALAALILKLLAKDPAARPPSARAVAAAIRDMEKVSAARPLRRMVVAAGLIVAAVAVAVVITIRQRDGKETTVNVPDGGAVTVDANGVATIVQPAQVVSDRKAAEWVQGCGGRVILRVGNADVTVDPGQPLPAGRWTVVGVDMYQLEKVTDAGLANLAGLTGLTHLKLAGVPVTDAGVEYLKGLTALTSLQLDDCPRVTDVGLISLKKLARLEILSLHGASVTDAGLRHLAESAALTDLNVSATQVTDAGLAHLKRLTALRKLHLTQTAVTGRGLTHLNTTPNLTTVNLSDAAVTDDSLRAVGGLNALTELWLADNPEVTDRGLAHLTDMKRLGYLNLHGTGVTDDGLRHLAALPALEDLNLSMTKVTNDGMGQVSDVPNLKVLHLYRTRVGDAGLKRLAGCKKLARLFLPNTGVTDAGLKDVAALPALTELDIHSTAVTDAGLAHLKAAPRLMALALHVTKTTDAGLAHVAALAELVYLDLRGTAVTTPGVESLKGLAKLRGLRLEQTAVTAADAARLRQLLPACHITTGSAGR